MKRNQDDTTGLPVHLSRGRGDHEDAPVAAISGRIGASQIGDLCRRVRELFAKSDAPLVIVDVSGVIEPDMTALDALARLHLAARRMGRQIKIRHSCEQLQDLIGFAGLRDVLLGCDEAEDPGAGAPTLRE